MNGTIARERRMVRKFAEAGAFSPDSARSLEQVGISEGRILRRLRERLVIRHTDGDRFYLDEEAWEALRKRRRRHASVAVVVALAVMLAVLLFSSTAHARQSRASWPEVDAVFASWNTRM